MTSTIVRRIRWGAMLALCAITVMALVGAACNADATTTSDTVYTEPLVAPPNVTPPIPRGTTKVVVNLKAEETVGEIAPGVTYSKWTFNGSTPGPLIRATVGQTVQINLTNASTNTMIHDVDLHAVLGPGGGAGATSVAPGETKSFSFRATSSGLFVYHCAAGLVADHISNGMYGGILIDPAGGQDTVTHEYYVGQNEYYTTGDTGAKGMQDMDLTKMINEQPTYVTFNGNTQSLTTNPLTSAVGDTVRIYFVDGGPNLTSSFH
ncbi:MAG: multicopper oxidase domain-containing protein, partial [Tepidiformaceae bacterium]